MATVYLAHDLKHERDVAIKSASGPCRVRCSVSSVIVAIGAPRGACVLEDSRGDVYLGTLPGVTR
jgi:hypothetical protein